MACTLKYSTTGLSTQTTSEREGKMKGNVSGTEIAKGKSVAIALIII